MDRARALAELGIDLPDIAAELEAEALDKFVKRFDAPAPSARPNGVQANNSVVLEVRGAYSTMRRPRNMPMGQAKLNSPGSFGISSTGTVSPVGRSALF